jgi:hypothetical protein
MKSLSASDTDNVLADMQIRFGIRHHIINVQERT